MLEDQRFRRLQHLLDQSNIYCRFLMERMDEQHKEQAKMQEKQAKKQDEETPQTKDPEQQVVHLLNIEHLWWGGWG